MGGWGDGDTRWGLVGGRVGRQRASVTHASALAHPEVGICCHLLAAAHMTSAVAEVLWHFVFCFLGGGFCGGGVFFPIFFFVLVVSQIH